MESGPDPLTFILDRLQDLDLTERVSQQIRTFIGGGGFSDVYKGELHRSKASGGTASCDPLLVAIKSIRANLEQDMTFKKVN